MQGAKQHITINQNLTYSTTSLTFSQSLQITNHSDLTYVFKIKTNQKTVVSMEYTHQFIKPNTTKSINIKLIDKPTESPPLKLQLNYGIPSKEDLANKDSKMNSHAKENIYKRIITIKRNDEAVPEKGDTQINSPKKQILESIHLSTNSLPQHKANATSPIHSPSGLFSKTESQSLNVQNTVSQQIDISQHIEAATLDKLKIKTVQSIIEQAIPQDNKSKEVKPAQLFESQPMARPLSDSQKIEDEYKNYVNIMNDSSQVVKLVDFQKENKKIIEQLNEKILRETELIKQLKNNRSASAGNSVYPFHIILMMMIVAFCLGSFTNWLAFE